VSEVVGVIFPHGPARSFTLPIEIGDTFGKLVVLGSDADDDDRFACQYSCGNQVSVLGLNLVSGWAVSCGCTPCNLCKSQTAGRHVCRHTKRLLSLQRSNGAASPVATLSYDSWR
jgi:hypothetical protein